MQKISKELKSNGFCHKYYRSVLPSDEGEVGRRRAFVVSCLESGVIGMRSIYVENLGCSKNQVDAEVMLACLGDEFLLTEEAGEADLILVNSCGFIQSAREESVEAFFALHEANPTAKIILSGCMAERYRDELDAELTEAAAIFGNRDLSKIREVVDRVFAGERIVSTPSYGDPAGDVYERNELLNYPGSAYLKISEGCNHRCSYCAIPLIRGGLRSRPMEQIIAEAEKLVHSGVKEINLIAQDLAAYGTDREGRESRFMELLASLVALDGDFKIRLLYIHPDAFPSELPAFIKKNPKVLPYFDIPFQHADTKIPPQHGTSGDQGEPPRPHRLHQGRNPRCRASLDDPLGVPGGG